MGNCCGGVSDGPHSKYWKKYQTDFESLGFGEKEIKTIHSVFHEVETKGINPDGTVLLSAVLNHFPGKLGDHLFLKKAFSIFSKEEDRLTFREFVHALHNFCSLTHLCLVRFAFDLYNPNGKTKLALSEMRKLIFELHGPIPDKDEGRYIVMDVARNKLSVYLDGEDYTCHNFVDFCHLHQPGFSPMYDIQERFQKFILGLSYWLNKAKKREEEKKFKTIKAMVDEYDNWGKIKAPVPGADGSHPDNPGAAAAAALTLPGTGGTKLTLKAAHAQVHPTDHHINPHRRGSKENNDMGSTGDEEGGSGNHHHNANVHNEERPRRGSKDGSSPATLPIAAGFDVPIMPHKKEVNHLNIESNFRSVAQVELRRKSYVQDDAVTHNSNDGTHHDHHHGSTTGHHDHTSGHGSTGHHDHASGHGSAGHGSTGNHHSDSHNRRHTHA